MKWDSSAMKSLTYGNWWRIARDVSGSNYASHASRIIPVIQGSSALTLLREYDVVTAHQNTWGMVRAASQV